ncbi:hypothetical protein QVD17_41480 [Tagetes erecta]|uniref:Uncharacterized protein n=1 Tax=Tagetes erecta TaxID=13708 RepID=A0AAD8JM72_TARER|nr:hypothetical protein QVD17_41480 [Tagetes erecta]
MMMMNETTERTEKKLGFGCGKYVDFVEENYEVQSKVAKDVEKVIISSDEEEHETKKDVEEVTDDLPLNYPTHEDGLPVGDLSKFDMDNLSEVNKLNIEIGEMNRRIKCDNPQIPG